MISLRIRLVISGIALAALCRVSNLPVCHAVVLNDDYFVSSGGDPTNAATVAATLDAGYADARAFSIQEQFLAVGTIGQCTTTWIGNDVSSDSSFFLTAAHCIEPDPKEEVFEVGETFTDWDGNVVASGTGTGHIPPERVNVPPGFGGSSTDAAIIELPGQVTILDGSGQPVERPLFYDGANEVGNEVSIVGYGSWGIGSLGSDGSLFPSSGARRAGGKNTINLAFESNHALRFTFDVPGTGDAIPLESNTASGDSGSAYWQQHDGHWSMIATTCCGSTTSYGGIDNGTRLSQYTDWIRSVYPLAQLWSEVDLTLTDLADINNDTFVDDGDVTAFVAQWRNGSLPTSPNPADLNQDGLVNLPDAFILHEELAAAGLGGLNFELLTSVPEPSSAMLLAVAATGMLFNWPPRMAAPGNTTCHENSLELRKS
jgi:hypothetical protein